MIDKHEIRILRPKIREKPFGYGCDLLIKKWITETPNSASEYLTVYTYTYVLLYV